MIAKNIKYLRSNLNLSQAKFAELFGWTRAAVSSYEDGRAVPPYSKLKGFAAYFDLSVGEIDSKDLSSAPRVQVQPEKLIVDSKKVVEDFKDDAKPEVKRVDDATELGSDLGPLFEFQQEEPLRKESVIDTSHHLIQEVDMIGANVAYEKLLNSPSVSSFPQMSIPLYQKGNFKAFESRKDSPNSGTWYIAKHVSNWFEIEDGSSYFIVSEKEGIFHRRVYNEIRLKGDLLLSGLKQDLTTLSIPYRAVDEVWQVIGELNYGTKSNLPALGHATRLAEELAEELKRLS